MIVADTNLIAYLLIDSAQTAQAEAILEKDGDWHAPSLWRHEFRNILATDVKLIIIANVVADIDFYQIVRVKGHDYTIKTKIDTVVGSQAALFTIVAQL